MLISLPIAEWLEWHAGMQGVAGSIPGGGIHYRFEQTNEIKHDIHPE